MKTASNVATKKISFCAALLSAVLLTGCGPSQESQTTDAIQQKLQSEYGDQYEVPSINIIAFESNGSTVDPEFRTRFEGVMKSLQPRYEPAGDLTLSNGAKYILVELVHESGAPIDVYGKATTVMQANKLVTTIDEIDFKNGKGGYIMSGFKSPIIKDSEEHARLLAISAALEAQNAKALDAVSKRLLGNWSGTLLCQGRLDAAKLEVVKAVAGKDYGFMEAIYSEDIKGKPFAYALKGRFTPEGEFRIDPDHWIHEVYGSSWTSLVGKVSPDAETISGEGVQYCRALELKRT